MYLESLCLSIVCIAEQDVNLYLAHTKCSIFPYSMSDREVTNKVLIYTYIVRTDVAGKQKSGKQ